MRKDTIQHKFKQSFYKFKDITAIEIGNDVVTYSELDIRTDVVANQIIRKGVKKETFIGVVVDDRREFIFSMIGILKANCVFIPLEPGYPDKRLEAMINSTDIEYVIIDKTNYSRSFARESTVGFIHIKDFALQEKDGGECDKIAINYHPEDKVYIYFTSGTTGEPKAVIGKNESLLHFINWEIGEFSINETYRCSQFTNPGFDVYLRDILVPLCAGGTICIPANIEINSEQLTAWIENKGINLIHCVPAIFRVFNTPGLEKENFKALEYILLAGEKVIPRELENWYDKFGERIQLVNLYGPTETTLAKAFYRIRSQDTRREIMPIGKHIDGARLIILDEHMKACEKLVKGEIYIRTPYRSFGYYKDPTLNKKKFIPNPYSNDPDDILYKTGDLGQVLPDGNIEIHGRIDRQVKIRGIRIELEAIEHILLQHPLVKEAVVIKAVNDNNEFLIAGITRPEDRDEEDDLFINILKKYLSENLLAVMIPSNIIILEEIPRKTNGKVDYNKISEMNASSEVEYIPPGNEVEMKLAEQWTDILKLKTGEIGINHNFFESGGSSLNVMTLIHRIHREFDTRLTLGEIFNNPTIKMQGEIIKKTRKDKYISIKFAEAKEYYSLSPAQKRLYFLQRMEIENTSYNLPFVLNLQGNLDIEKFEESFKRLISRHDSLRTSFRIVDENPAQEVHKRVDFKINYYQVGEVGRILQDFIRPFDLSQAPLMRVGLIKQMETKYFLMVDMHHIITDGNSQVLLTNEFTALYAGEELSLPRLRYTDYSEWFNGLLPSLDLKKQEGYWLQEFAGDVTPFRLSTDYPRSEVRSFEGEILRFGLDPKEIEALNKIARDEAATLYMVLLAIINIMLSKITGRENVIIGTPVAGRGHRDLEQLVGIFINTLALRNHPKGEKTFTQFLGEVKKRTLQAFENQSYQFEDLVNKVAANRNTKHNPLFDVMFSFQNRRENPRRETSIQANGLKVTQYELGNIESKFDITIRISDLVENLIISFEYCKKLFKRETMERYFKYFREILLTVIENKHIRLHDITISHDLLESPVNIPQMEFGL